MKIMCGILVYVLVGIKKSVELIKFEIIASAYYFLNNLVIICEGFLDVLQSAPETT